MEPFLTVQINPGQYKALKHLLNTLPKEIPRVMTRAINKVAKATFTRIIKRITKDYAVKSKELKERNLTLRRANFRNQTAIIKIKGRRIRLLAFRARQLKKGVSYQIKKSRGRRKVYAFMESPPGTGRPTTMSSGHKGVFRRKGKARLPIIELFGPSIPAIFQTTPEFEEGVLNRDLSNKLGREIIKQAEYIIFKHRGVTLASA